MCILYWIREIVPLHNQTKTVSEHMIHSLTGHFNVILTRGNQSY